VFLNIKLFVFEGLELSYLVRGHKSIEECLPEATGCIIETKILQAQTDRQRDPQLAPPNKGSFPDSTDSTDSTVSPCDSLELPCLHVKCASDFFPELDTSLRSLYHPYFLAISTLSHLRSPLQFSPANDLARLILRYLLSRPPSSFSRLSEPVAGRRRTNVSAADSLRTFIRCPCYSATLLLSHKAVPTFFNRRSLLPHLLACAFVLTSISCFRSNMLLNGGALPRDCSVA
jgi:hypothetical protein